MSLYKQKKSPFWWCEFTVAGERIRRSTGVRDKREAAAIEKAEREKAEREATTKALVTAETVSLRMEDAGWRYWEEVKDSLAGARNIKRDIVRLIKFFGVSKLLSEIDDKDVKALVAHRSSDRVPIKNRKAEDCPFVSPGTVNHTVVRLQALFDHAREVWKVQGLVEPIWKNHKLDVPRKPARVFVGDEKERFFKATRPDFAPVFGFAFESAKRLDYCATLRWTQVHWERGVIEKPGKRKPGGKEKIETVQITPEIRAILEPLVGHHPTYVFAYAAKRKRGGRLRGARYPIKASYLETEFKRTCERAGVSHFGFHCLRRSGATEFYDATGNDLLLTQRFLGHADPATTARYISRDDKAVKAGMEKRAAMRASAGPAHDSPIPAPHTKGTKVA
jgi:integrase